MDTVKANYYINIFKPISNKLKIYILCVILLLKGSFIKNLIVFHLKRLNILC